MVLPEASVAEAVPSARERILDTAYALFTLRGVREVSMDAVIASAAVAKATLYRHFPTKNDLVLAVLARREQLWTREFIELQSRERGNTAEEQLLAIFDVLDDWYRQRDGYDGCSFIKVLLEMGATHPAGAASIDYIAKFRDIMCQRAQAAGFRDPDGFARSFNLITHGTMIAATEGDAKAARRGRELARLLIAEHCRRPRTADAGDI